MKLLGTLLALVGKFYVSRSMSLLESAMTGRNRLRLRYGPQQTIVAALVAPKITDSIDTMEETRWR
jgi:hypothetical protein